MDLIPVRKDGVGYMYDKVSGTLIEQQRLSDTAPVFALGGDVAGESYIAGTITLDADADWTARGMLHFESDAVIDLNGHSLTIVGAFGDGTITDSSSGAPGELHIVTPPFSEIESSLALTGNLKVVTEGPGWLAMTKAGQTFTGGVLVAEGTAYSPQGSKYHEDLNFWGPAGTTITISNATFDVRGNTDYYNKTFVLDGGTLASSASDMNASSCGFGDITLLSNSTFDLRGHTCFTIPDGAGSTRIDLGGNTLTVALGSGKHMYLNKEVANGTLDFTSGGYLHTIAGALSGSPTVNVEMRGAALNLEADMCVSNYVARYTSAYNHGSGAFKVYGTFTPDAVLANGNECFHGCEMQNGSSIDLSAKTNAWSSVALGWTGTGNMTWMATARRRS